MDLYIKKKKNLKQNKMNWQAMQGKALNLFHNKDYLGSHEPFKEAMCATPYHRLQDTIKWYTDT